MGSWCGHRVGPPLYRHSRRSAALAARVREYRNQSLVFILFTESHSSAADSRGLDVVARCAVFVWTVCLYAQFTPGYTPEISSLGEVAGRSFGYICSGWPAYIRSHHHLPLDVRGTVDRLDARAFARERTDAPFSVSVSATESYVGTILINARRFSNRAADGSRTC